MFKLLKNLLMTNSLRVKNAPRWKGWLPFTKWMENCILNSRWVCWDEICCLDQLFPVLAIIRMRWWDKKIRPRYTLLLPWRIVWCICGKLLILPGHKYQAKVKISILNRPWKWELVYQLWKDLQWRLIMPIVLRLCLRQLNSSWVTTLGWILLILTEKRCITGREPVGSVSSQNCLMSGI